MAIVENTPTRLAISAGSGLGQTKLTLDKSEGRALLERKMLAIKRKPVEIALSEIEAVDVVGKKDAASGAVVHQPVLRTRGGEAIPIAVEDEQAENTARCLRGFLGLDAA